MNKNLFRDIKAEITGQEMSLYELDDYMQTVTSSTTSIFNYDREYWDGFIWKVGEDDGIIVDFDILNDPEDDDLEIKVLVKKVTEF